MDVLSKNVDFYSLKPSTPSDVLHGHDTLSTLSSEGQDDVLTLNSTRQFGRQIPSLL